MKSNLFAVASLMAISLLTDSCSTKADQLVSNGNLTMYFGVTIFANMPPQKVTLDEFTLAQIQAPSGVKIRIIETKNVSVSPSGWAVSKSGSEAGYFSVEVINCYLKCPVDIVISISN